MHDFQIDRRQVTEFFQRFVFGDAKKAGDAIQKAASKLGIQPIANTDIAKSVGHLLKHDKRATALRRLALEPVVWSGHLYSMQRQHQ